MISVADHLKHDNNVMKNTTRSMEAVGANIWLLADCSESTFKDAFL